MTEKESILIGYLIVDLAYAIAGLEIYFNHVVQKLSDPEKII